MVNIWKQLYYPWYGQALLQKMEKYLYVLPTKKSLEGLASGVNFTIISQAAFTHTDPKSAKNTVKSSSFLPFWDLRL